MKTITMGVGEQADCYIDGHNLNRIDLFKYIGCYVNKDCKLKDAIAVQIQTVSSVIGRLWDKVFDCRALRIETKLKVYDQCITSLMMYRSEIWMLYCHHTKLLKTVQ